MKYIGIHEGKRGSVIKVLMNIDRCVQNGIDYSRKYNSTNMGGSCVLSANYFEANIISNTLKTRLGLKFSCIKVNKYSMDWGSDIVS